MGGYADFIEHPRLRRDKARPYGVSERVWRFHRAASGASGRDPPLRGGLPLSHEAKDLALQTKGSCSATL